MLVKRFLSILTWILRRSQVEQRLDDELQACVDASAAEKVRDGMSREDAIRQARLELGGVEQIKEHVRTGRHGWFLDEVARDLLYGFRISARAPGFTAVILVTLALGVGANTAIFTLIDALMLRRLPVQHADELVLLDLRDPATAGAVGDSFSWGGDSFSWSIARGLDARGDIFAGVAGFSGLSTNVGAPGASTRVSGALVTGDFYATLGVQPEAGRLLINEDDEPGAPLVAVISDNYWEREFGRRPAAIGESLMVNGVPVTIVGVSPRGFDGANVGQRAEIVTTVAAVPRLWPGLAEMTQPGNFWLRILARPAAGLSATAAETRLNVVWPALSGELLSARWPAARKQAMASWRFVFEPGATGWSNLRELYLKPLVVLMSVAALVLAIACANVASLFLARASTRGREIAIRLAIGASRGRIVRQLLIEGGMLSGAGTALGVGVAWWSSRLLVRLISSGPTDVVFDLTPNAHVLAFSAALAVATGLLFGLAPAIQARTAGPSLILKSDNRGATRRSRMLPSLVTGQVALSLILIAGAGLFVRTFRNLEHVDPGFRVDGVFLVALDRDAGALVDRLLDVVGAVPGVEAVTASTQTPLSGSSWSEAVVPVGQPVPETDNTRVLGVAPRYFAALRIPLVAGRDFSERDRRGAPDVAIVNEQYAARYFPHQDPVGQRLKGTLASPAREVEIVGVARDTSASSLRREPPPIVYVSREQFGQSQAPNLIVRTTGGDARTSQAIRAALQSRLPTRTIQVQPLSAQIDGTILQERVMATLAAGFGALALLLSTVGLYGLLAYRVTQRSREIGIRLALGANARRVVADVVLSGVRLVGLGVAIGIPAAWLLSKPVRSMLFGLTPTDPPTLLAAALVLVVAALLAAAVPARRAASVEPVVVLKQD
jgi:predicted permease